MSLNLAVVITVFWLIFRGLPQNLSRKAHNPDLAGKKHPAGQKMKSTGG